MRMIVSQCCEEKIFSVHCEDGSHYVCDKCYRPCDTMTVDDVNCVKDGHS